MTLNILTLLNLVSNYIAEGCSIAVPISNSKPGILHAQLTSVSEVEAPSFTAQGTDTDAKLVV